MTRRKTKTVFWDSRWYSPSDLLDAGLRLCPRCERVLPLEAFYMRGSSKYAVSLCKGCYANKYAENASAIREQNRYNRLGVPIGTYDLLVRRHGAICSICGTDSPKGTGKENKQFSIDHDHDTGVVRGLLCSQCNVGIGMLKHDKRLLMSAINYLSQTGYSIEELKGLLENAYVGLGDDL